MDKKKENKWNLILFLEELFELESCRTPCRYSWKIEKVLEGTSYLKQYFRDYNLISNRNRRLQNIIEFEEIIKSSSDVFKSTLQELISYLEGIVCSNCNSLLSVEKVKDRTTDSRTYFCSQSCSWKFRSRKMNSIPKRYRPSLRNRRTI